MTEVWYRHTDNRFPFLWESDSQPAARWHGDGEGPAQYLADTADGAWAEFLRHEEITEANDLDGVERALWAVEIDQRAEDVMEPRLAGRTLTGSLDSYPTCRKEARHLRAAGASALAAPSAALVGGGARGQVVRGGLAEASDRDARVLVLFGTRPRARGWICTATGRPSPRLLELVRAL